ncbi:MAG: hypothetical protein ACLUOI_35650 [Eisenbergiella sp.]
MLQVENEYGSFGNDKKLSGKSQGHDA